MNYTRESNLYFYIAPKFRNSFAGSLPDASLSARRPNSIISLSSSASSGGSSVSSKLSNNNHLHHHRHHMHHHESEQPQSHCHLRSSSSSSSEMRKDNKKNVKQEKIVPCKFKYSRSTTVVSQCSTGNWIWCCLLSGINLFVLHKNNFCKLSLIHTWQRAEF